MRKYNTQGLLEKLESATRSIIATTNGFKDADTAILKQQPQPGSWSVVQVLEHLNSYGVYYLPAIEKAMKKDERPSPQVYTPGRLGEFFTRMMKPDENRKVRNKMKSPKAHRPPVELDAKAVMETFIQQQQHLLKLLHAAKLNDISGIKIPITLSRFIRLKLGDTFRFLIAHEQRHFVQIENALKEIKKSQQPKPATVTVG